MWCTSGITRRDMHEESLSLCVLVLSLYTCVVSICMWYIQRIASRGTMQQQWLSHMHIYILIYIRKYVYIYRCMHMYVKIYAHTHIYIYTYIMDVSCLWINVHMCTTLFHRGDTSSMDQTTLYNMLHHTASLYNTLQHTLQRTTSYCTKLHHTVPHYTTLQHTAPHCNTLQHTA